jgi:hypothetical protein
MAILTKVAARLEEQCLSLDKLVSLPSRTASSYINGIECEEDEAIQGLWANLLINVSDPARSQTPLRIYGELLSRLDHDQATLLNELGTRDYVHFWFIVAGSRYGDLEGTEMAGKTHHTNMREIAISTPFLEWEPNGNCYFCRWSPEKVEATVDALSTFGLLRRSKEVDPFELEGRETPPSVEEILEAAGGVDAFQFSQLGRDFYAAVSPPEPNI